MRKLFYIFVVIVILVFSSQIILLAANKTDVQPSVLTQQMLEKFPRNGGFSLKNFQRSTDEIPSQIEFEKYKDYFHNPEEFDKQVENHQKSLELYYEAFATGHVAVEEKPNLEDDFATYTMDDHKLFLVSLSQKIKDRRTSEALGDLEKSNRFLRSIVETPQSYAHKLIALTQLKKSADFVASLKSDAVLKNTPRSLKESFHLTQTPVQMFEEASKMELQLIASMLLPTPNQRLIEAQNPETTDTFKSWYNTSLVRPYETLNTLSQSYEQMRNPPCTEVREDLCKKSLETLNTKSGISKMLNPVGREIVNAYLSRSEKMLDEYKTKTQMLKEKTRAL